MDDVDFRLIQVLRDNSRATYRELADELGLSVNSAHKRVQDLIDLGIIKQFRVFLTPKALPQYTVRVCGRSDTTSIDDTAKALGKDPHTARVVVSSGNSFHVVGMLEDVSDINEYANFVIRNGLIMNPTVRLLDAPPQEAKPKVSLSDLDYRIIASLQNDGRKQIVDIAGELGTSAKTVRRRLRRMEENELVHYGVIYDHASLGGIFTLLDAYLKNGQDSRKAAAMIRKKYAKNLMEVRTFSTLPNDITMDVWTGTMNELKTIQRSLEDEGIFEKIVPQIEYNVYYFDSWRDQYVREKAREKE